MAASYSWRFMTQGRATLTGLVRDLAQGVDGVAVLARRGEVGVVAIVGGARTAATLAIGRATAFALHAEKAHTFGPEQIDGLARQTGHHTLAKASDDADGS